MPEPDRSSLAWRVAGELGGAEGEHQAGAVVVRAAAALVGAEAARVFLFDRSRGYRCTGTWPEGQRPADVPTEVARALAFGSAVAGSASDAGFRSRLVVPLVARGRPMGAIELLESGREAGPLSLKDADTVAPLVNAADLAMDTAHRRGLEQRNHLEAVERLSRLFDVGRTFARTLEIQPLVEVIVNRVQNALDTENAYLWLPEPESGRWSVAAAAGTAANAVVGWELEPGAGVAGIVAENGEPALSSDPDEIPGLEDRPDIQAGLEFVSLAAVPLLDDDGKAAGVIEVVNRSDGAPLDDGDRVFLQELAESAMIALGNARRLDAERRAGDLGELLAIAQEVGQHLDVQKVAYTLAHRPASVIGYRRAAVGLWRAGRFQVAAVSGQAFVDNTLPETKALEAVLHWASGLDEGVYVVQEEDGSIEAQRPETREKFRDYFAATGARSFLTVPLRDDEGAVGVFAIESAQPYAFSERDLEAAQLLGVQATVAIRNAILFQQIPMLGVMQPIARAKARVDALRGRRRTATLAAAAFVLVLLLVPVLPLRVGGDARVLPQQRLVVSAETPGRVAAVLVREGDRVEGGQEIARLDDAEARSAREAAAAQYRAAEREQNRLRAAGQTAAAAEAAAQLDGLAARLALADTELERTRIRARAPGVIVTPRIEDKVGVRLERGDPFCEIADITRQEIEIAVPERDAALVAPGMPAKVRLYGLPTSDVRARVERVGVDATEDDGDRVFLARAQLESAPAGLRSGMTGRAKISVHRAGLAHIVLRRPARWAWNILWGWMP